MEKKILNFLNILRNLKAFTCDTSFADSVGRKSVISDAYILLGGAPIYWESSLQSIVATSTAEAEYIALYTLAKEVKYLKMLLAEIFLDEEFEDNAGVNIFCDNTSNIKMVESPMRTQRTKHMDLRYNWVSECYHARGFNLKYVSA